MLIEEELAGEAVEVLQRLVALDEHAHQSHNYLGMARHRSGDRVGARASFERAYEQKPDSVETLVNLSVFEWEEGQVEAAVSYLEQAAECELSDNRDVIVNTAVMQVQTGHVEDGMRLLDEHVAANESDVEAVCILADIYWQQGVVERAKALAESALRWHENHGPALSLLRKSVGKKKKRTGRRKIKKSAQRARPLISLCVIARDEATFLGECLASVSGLVDEIVVVDTGIGRSHPSGGASKRCSRI